MKTAGERANGLRWRMRAMRRLWSVGANPDMRFLAPQPPEDPVAGRIDHPRPGKPIAATRTVTVSGWVALLAGPTTRVEVWLGATSLGLARVGLPRPDLAGSDLSPYAGISGFELTTELDEELELEEEMTLRVVATGADGEAHEIESVSVGPPAPARKRQSKKGLRPLPARTPRTGGGGLRVLVATHQLNLGGAQLYLLDLLRQLRRQTSLEFVVVSAIDGELRGELEDIGIPVHISSLVPVDDLSSHLGRIEELVAWAEPHDFELALVNTATAHAFPGAEAAERLGIPAVWTIHESFPPAMMWAGFDPGILERAEAALSGATRAVFEAEATRRLYESLVDPSRCVTLPYGLDLEPIERERERFDREAARRKAEIPADAEVILCVGTIEARKAQIPLAVAFDLIAERHPQAQLVFVGGRDDTDSQALEERIEASPWRERVRLEPITPDVLPWYSLADLLVCASDVESLPRTVLEAMALETPVLATEVFGLPELIDHGKTGWLCEPRDISALAQGLDEILSTPPKQRAEVARAARALIEHRHSLELYGNEMAKLLEDAAHDNPKPPSQHVATS